MHKRKIQSKSNQIIYINHKRKIFQNYHKRKIFQNYHKRKIFQNYHKVILKVKNRKAQQKSKRNI